MGGGGQDFLVAADGGKAHDRLAFGRAGELAAAAVADLGERGQAESQGVAVAGGGKAVDVGAHVGVFGVFDERFFAVVERAGVEAHGGDDFFAVFELEHLLDGLAVTGAGGDVDEAGGVAHPEVGEEPDGGAGAAAQAGQHRIAFAQAALGGVFDLALAFDPAVGGDQHVAVFGNDEVFGGVFDFAARVLDGGESLAAFAFAVGVQ